MKPTYDVEQTEVFRRDPDEFELLISKRNGSGAGHGEIIRTTLGEVDAQYLTRKVIFEDRPDNYAVAVEWRITRAGQRVYGGHDDELVRRDAHIILKQVPEAAPAAGGL